MAVELGLCLVIYLNLFDTPEQSHHVFLVHSSNLGVVVVMNKGHLHSREMKQILKHVYTLQGCHCIWL